MQDAVIHSFTSALHSSQFTVHTQFTVHSHSALSSQSVGSVIKYQNAFPGGKLGCLVAQRRGPVARELAAEAHGPAVGRGVAVHDGHAPIALLLDAEVVAAHLDAEPAVLAPVRAPAVAPDPVVDAVVGAPAVDGDLVVDHVEQLLLRIHTARVGVEVLGGVDTGTDGATREDLGLDLVGAGHAAVVANLVHERVGHLGAVAGREGVGRIAGARHARLAIAEVAALEVLRLVGLAGLVRDARLVRVRVHAARVAAVAGAAAAAVDEHLGGQVDGWPRALAHDRDAVRQRARGALRPAGAAVLGDVLVLIPRAEVGAVDVAPVPRGGEVRRREVRVRQRRGDAVGLGELEGGLLHAAGLLLRRRRGRGLGQRRGLVDGEGEAAGSIVDARHGELAVALDAEVVDALGDAEPARLAPVAAPRVAADPVVALLGVRAVPDDADRVVERLGPRRVLEHAAAVRLELRRHRDRAGDGAALGELGLHGGRAVDEAVLLHEVLVELGLGEAAAARLAVATHVGVAACIAGIVARGLVQLAGLLRDALLVHELVRRDGVAAVAAVVVRVAVEDDLHGGVHLALGARVPRDALLVLRAHDAHAVRHGGGRGEGPARAAVVGDVLVAGGGGEARAVDVAPVDGRGRRGALELEQLVRARRQHVLVAVRGLLESQTVEVLARGGGRHAERGDEELHNGAMKA